MLKTIRRTGDVLKCVHQKRSLTSNGRKNWFLRSIARVFAASLIHNSKVSYATLGPFTGRNIEGQNIVDSTLCKNTVRS